MDLTLFVIADYANATVDGKLYLMGAFNQILAENFPTTHPEMYLVVQLSAGPSEYGRSFILNTKLVDQEDQDRNYILHLSTVATLPNRERGQRVVLNHILKLANVTFPKPGIYSFSVEVDHEIKGTLPVELIQVAVLQA